MKIKNLLLASLLWTLCLSVFSQSNVFELEYASGTSITRGNQNLLKVKLRVTNSLKIQNGSYVFKTNANGLYISNPLSSVSSGVSIALNNNELILQFNEVAGSQIDIDFEAWAGFCFAFAKNDPQVKTISSPFILINEATQASLSLIKNSDINIDKGPFIDYQETRSSTNVSTVIDATSRMTAIFKYIIKNTSSVAFSGALSFQESAVGKAYNISSVGFYKNGSLISSLHSNPSSGIPNNNNNDFITNNPIVESIVDLQPSEEITIVETVILNGCLNPSDGSIGNGSKPLIKWGFTTDDLCGQYSTTIGTFITNSVAPKISYDNSQSQSNHGCFGDYTGTQRSFVMTNAATATDVARNVMLRLNTSYASPIMVPYDENDIYIEINGVRYKPNFTKYNLDFSKVYNASNFPDFVPSDFYAAHPNTNGNTDYGYQVYRYATRQSYDGFDFRVNGLFSQDIYNTKVVYPNGAPVSQANFPLSMDCVGGFNQPLVFDLFIDEYIDGGVSKKINLNPGDKLELFWKEKSCFFKNDVVFGDVNSPNVFVEYDEFCIHQSVQASGGDGAGRSLFDLTFKPEAASSTTTGEVDKCYSTADGLVERISSRITSTTYLREPPPFTNNNGRVVFRIYLQNGFDLDKSLTVPNSFGWTHNNLGYNNVTDDPLFVQNASTSCAEQTCSGCALTNVLNPNNYYVRLRPALNSGSLSISPTNVRLIASSTKTTGQSNNDLIFNGSQIANFLYEASFNVSDLNAFFNLNTGTTGHKTMGDIKTLLTDAFLDFDIRAYCSSLDGPSAYKVVMYMDRCSDGLDPKFQISTTPNSGLTGMIPLSSFGGAMIINCPGCKVPGGNIEFATLIRADESKGLLDNNNDNIPDDATSTLPNSHPTLKIAAMGDILECRFNEYMSDGESIDANVNGITIQELAALNPNYLLDNLYIRISFSGNANISNTSAQNIDIMELKVNDKVITLDATSIASRTAKQIILRLNVKQLYGDTETHFAGQRNAFVIKFKVLDMGRAPVVCDVTYEPFYSPCDNCSDLTSPAMTEVNPAVNPNFLPFTRDNIYKVVNLGNKALWKCTGFSNTFKFIPYSQQSTFAAYDKNCTKTLSAAMTGAFLEVLSDQFQSEFRTFLKDDLKFSIPIPNGYNIQQIQIDNVIVRNGPLTYHEYFNIDNQGIINPLVTADASSASYSRMLNMNLKYKPLSSTTVFDAFSSCIGANTFCKNTDDVLPDGISASMILGDQSYNVTINVTLIKDENTLCTVIPDYDVFPPTTGAVTYKVSSNLPDNGYGSIPAVTQKGKIYVNPNASLSASTDFMPRWLGNTSHFVYTPLAGLKGTNNANLIIPTISSNTKIQIPIHIKNDYTVHNGVTSSVQRADYPFIRISGAALDQGLRLEGIYKGNKNILNPASSKYYKAINSSTVSLITEGIIVGIDQYDADLTPKTPGYIPILSDGANHPTDYDYTLVFSYACPSSCEPNVGCGTDSRLPAACLQGTNNLSVQYGWNCNKYPDFGDLPNICGQFTPILYTVNSAPVGLTYSASAGNGAGTAIVPLCQDFDYAIDLNSCKEGNISNLKVDVQLPPGMSYVSNDRGFSPTVSSSGLISFANVLTSPFVATPNSFNSADGPKVLKLKLRYNSFDGKSADIGLSMDGTYYGRSIVGAKVNTSVIANSLITGLAATYCVGNGPVTITSTLSDGSFVSSSSAALTDNGNGTAIFSPEIAGVGTHTVTYTKAGTSCSETHTIVVTNCIKAVIETNPFNSCVKSPVSISGSVTGATGVVTYNWCVYQGTSGCTYSLSGQTPNFAIPLPGVYNVSLTVADASGATNTVTSIGLITINPLPEANAGPDQLGCVGDTKCYILSAISPDLIANDYTWTDNVGTAVTTPNCVKPNSTSTYSLNVTNKSTGCKATDDVTITINPLPVITVDTKDHLGSFLVSGCRSSVVLEATAGFTSYTWYYKPATSGAYTVITGFTQSEYTATTAGWYKVEVTVNGCTNSDQIQVVDQISLNGTPFICPGENNNLSVYIGGIKGRYYVQWYENATELTTHPTGAGNFYAAVVLPDIIPACSLTAGPFLVQEKQLPPAYTIAGGDINYCSGDGDVTLNAVAPSSTAGIAYYQWSTGNKNEDHIIVNNSGSYQIVTKGSNGCSSYSNVVHLLAPSLVIKQRCMDDGSVDLYVDVNVGGVSSYTWTNSAGSSAGTGNLINVKVDDQYTVTTTDLRCGNTATTQVCLNSTPMALNVVQDFNTSSITDPCKEIMDFHTEMFCTNSDLDLNTWPGHVMITDNADRISNAVGKWGGLAFLDPLDPTDDHFLIADGAVEEGEKKIWYTTVNVEKCATYSFGALVRNINVGDQELPVIYLKIGNHKITSRTIFKSSPWAELGNVWKSDVSGPIEISIILGDGGWIGRDIGVDEIEFKTVDCDFTPRMDCDAVAFVGMDKYILPGCSTQLGFNRVNPNLIFTWTGSDGKTYNQENITVSPITTTNYTLLVEDKVNGCTASDQISVTVVQPTVTITGERKNCAMEFKASQFNGAGGVQYKWYVNDILVGTNSTGVFTSTDVKKKDKVKCQLMTTCSTNPFSNEITITDDLPYADAGADQKLCSGATATLTANPAGASYLWSTGETTQSIKVSVAGTYVVTVTDASGCAKTDNVDVIVHPAFFISSADATPASICSGGTSQLGVTINNGAAPYTFEWYESGKLIGKTNPLSVSPDKTTYYGVTATDANGCTFSASLSVVVNPTPTVTAGPNVAICFGGTTSLSAVASGGTAPYSYSWSPASGLNNASIQNPVASPKASSIYAVFTRDAKGCISPASNVTVTVNPRPSVSAGPNVTICSGNTTNLNAKANGGTSPITYNWTPATWLSNSTIQNPVASPIESRTYTVVAIDANGCESTPSNVSITVNPLPVVNAGPDQSKLANGSPVQINTSVSGGVLPYTYSWSPTTRLVTPTSKNPRSYALSTTIYTFTVQDANKCMQSDNVTIYVPAQVNVTSLKNCATGKVILTASLQDLPSNLASYQWQRNIVSSLYSNISGATQLTYSAPSSGTYRVRVTLTNGDVLYSSPVVTSIGVMSATSSVSSSIMCLGGSSTISTNITNGKAPFTYNINGENVATMPTNVSPVSNTSYSIKVTDAYGCIATSNVGVQVNTVVANASATLSEICSGQSVVYTSNPTGGTAPYRYDWRYGSIKVGSGKTVGPVTLTSTTTLNLRVSDAIGCETTQSVKVTVNTVPGKPLTPTGPTILCQNALNTNYIISNPVVGATSYKWSITPSNAGSISGSGVTATVDWADTYLGTALISIQGVNSCGEGTASDAITVTLSGTPPAANTINGPLIVCNNAPNANYQASNIAGVLSYQWSILPSSAGTIASINGNNAIIDWSNTYVGTAVISVRGVNNCGVGSSRTVSVNVSNGPATPQVPVGPTSVCTVNMPFTTYNIAGVPNATSYNWSVNPAIAATSIVSRGTNATINWNRSYTGNDVQVLVSANSTCGAGATSSLAISISTNLLSTPSIPNGQICRGTNTSISNYIVNPVAGAIRYEWILVPQNAGTITGSGNSAVVVWNNAYRGQTQIYVHAINNCGTSAWSAGRLVNFVTGACKESADIDEGENAVEKDLTVTLYPNPTESESNVYITGTLSSNVKLVMYNLEGVEVFEMKDAPVNKTFKIGNELYPGLYFIKITDENETKIVKFLKD